MQVVSVIKVAAKILCTLIQEWKCLPIYGNPTVCQAFLPCCEEVFSISSGFEVKNMIESWCPSTNVSAGFLWKKMSVFVSVLQSHCRRVCLCVRAGVRQPPVRSVSITVSPTQWATDGGQTSVSYAAVFPTSQCSAPPTVHTLPLAALRWEDVCGCCSFLLAKATKNISTLVLLLCFKCCSPVATLVSFTDFTD